MSGWGFQDWAGAVLLLAVFLLSGLVLLLRRPPLGGSWWTYDRLHGLLSIIVGLTYVRDPGKFGGGGGWVWIAMGGLFLAGALWLLFVDPIFEARRLREHDAELASLAGHAAAYSAAAYDTELRAVQAGAPSPMTRRHRVGAAAALVLVGGAMLTLGLIRARA